MSKEILSESEARMKKSIESVQNEFNKIRTGRASFALLAGVSVEYYGTPTPINQVANVSIPEARLLVIQPWDPKIMPDIEKAIQKADINISPINDGKVIRLPIPQLTEERRRDLVKDTKNILEDGKVAIRNIRRESNDALKKAEKGGDLSEDERKRSEDEIQKQTDKHIKELDQLSEVKEKEIMTV